MAVYVQIEGIQGDATHQDHKEWLDVQHIAWGVGRGIQTTVGAAGNREASQPSLSEVTLSRITDKATPAIFYEACTGKVGKKVVIHFVTTGDPGDTYLEYTLSNTLISNYQMSSGGDRPTEVVGLSFTKIEVKYTPYDDQNKPKSPLAHSYDMATGSK